MVILVILPSFPIQQQQMQSYPPPWWAYCERLTIGIPDDISLSSLSVSLHCRSAYWPCISRFKVSSRAVSLSQCSLPGLPLTNYPPLPLVALRWIIEVEQIANQLSAHIGLANAPDVPIFLPRALLNAYNLTGSKHSHFTGWRMRSAIRRLLSPMAPKGVCIVGNKATPTICPLTQRSSASHNQTLESSCC
jgi:hypothetical protein